MKIIAEIIILFDFNMSRPFTLIPTLSTHQLDYYNICKEEAKNTNIEWADYQKAWIEQHVSRETEFFKNATSPPENIDLRFRYYLSFCTYSQLTQLGV